MPPLFGIPRVPFTFIEGTRGMPGIPLVPLAQLARRKIQAHVIKWLRR